MRHYKLIDGNYILAVGTGKGGEEIAELEYNEILTVIHNKPARTESIDYRLKTDLTWEEYEHEPDPEDIPDAEEILNILMGVEE